MYKSRFIRIQLLHYKMQIIKRCVLTCIPCFDCRKTCIMLSLLFQIRMKEMTICQWEQYCEVCCVAGNDRARCNGESSRERSHSLSRWAARAPACPRLLPAWPRAPPRARREPPRAPACPRARAVQWYIRYGQLTKLGNILLWNTSQFVFINENVCNKGCIGRIYDGFILLTQ